MYMFALYAKFEASQKNVNCIFQSTNNVSDSKEDLYTQALYVTVLLHTAYRIKTHESNGFISINTRETKEGTATTSE